MVDQRATHRCRVYTACVCLCVSHSPQYQFNRMGVYGGDGPPCSYDTMMKPGDKPPAEVVT